MNLNLIQFADLKIINEYAPRFKDEVVIVAQNFSMQELEEFNKEKRKSKTKILSCKVIEKKDNNELQKFRKKADLIAIRGGSLEMNSWAVHQKIDLLLQPFTHEKNSLDLQTCNILKDNNIFVCFLFNEFLNSRGFKQTQLIKNASFALVLLQKAKTPFLFVSGAKEKNDLRAAKDFSSFGVMLGMKKEDALKTVRTSEKLLEGLK